MASGEDDDLLALRSAVMATMKKTKEEDIGDDAELVALREAALMTKRRNAEKDRQESPSRHKVGVPFTGVPPFKMAKGSNLIVISTISDEEKTEDESAKSRLLETQGQSQGHKLLRPQDKWLSENSQSSTSSPLRPKVQDKFSRFESSGSDSENSSDSESSEEETQNQSKDNSESDDEPAEESEDSSSDDGSFVTKSEVSTAEDSDTEENTQSESQSSSKPESFDSIRNRLKSNDNSVETLNNSESKPSGRLDKGVDSLETERTGRDIAGNRRNDKYHGRNPNEQRGRYATDGDRDQVVSSRKRDSEHGRYSDSAPRFSRGDRDRRVDEVRSYESRRENSRDKESSRRPIRNGPDKIESYDRRRDNSRDRERTRRSFQNGPDDQLKSRIDSNDRRERRSQTDRRDGYRSRDRNRNTNNKRNEQSSSRSDPLRNKRADDSNRRKADDIDNKNGKRDKDNSSEKQSSAKSDVGNDKSKRTSSSSSSDSSEENDAESVASAEDEDSDSDSGGRGRRQLSERNTQDIEIERRKRQHQEIENERQKWQMEREKRRQEVNTRREKAHETKPRSRNDNGEKDGRRSVPERRGEREPRNVPTRNPERVSEKHRSKKYEERNSLPRSKSRSPVIKSLLSFVTKDRNPVNSDVKVTTDANIGPRVMKKERRETQVAHSATNVTNTEEGSTLEHSSMAKRNRALDAREVLRQKRKQLAGNLQYNSDPNVSDQTVKTSNVCDEVAVKQKRFSRIEAPGKEKGEARTSAGQKRKKRNRHSDDESPSKKPTEEKRAESPTIKITFNSDPLMTVSKKKSVYDRLGHPRGKSTPAVGKPMKKPVPLLSVKTSSPRTEKLTSPIKENPQPLINIAKTSTVLKPKLLITPKPGITETMEKTQISKKQGAVITDVTKTLVHVDKSKKTPMKANKDFRKVVSSNAAGDERRVVRNLEAVKKQDTRHVIKMSASCDSGLDAKPVKPVRKIKLVRKPVLVKSVSDTTT